MPDPETDLDATLDAVLIGGREEREVIIVDYSPAWLHRFEKERHRIAAALGAVAGRIEHIGSTAVPGLAAKPIVDVLVAVEDPEDEERYVPALECAGDVLRVREPGHRMFRTPELHVHVHICSSGSDWERRHLLLRDWLSESAEDREAYAALKIELQGHEWETMNHYAEAKSILIAEMTTRAERWAARIGWSP